MVKTLADGYFKAIVDALPEVPAFVLNDDAEPIKVHLFTNNDIIDPAGNMAQFTLPTYTGYAAHLFPPTGGAPIIFRDQTSGAWVMKLGTGFFFQPTAAVSPTQTMYGYVLRGTADASAFLWAEKFDTPVEFSSAADGLEVNPELLIPFSAFM